MKTPPCIHVHKYQVSLHTHSNQSRLLSATSHTLSLALLRLLLLLGKLAVGDRCGKTFPPARASYYVLDDVSKSQLQVSFDSPPPFPRDAKSDRHSRYICATGWSKETVTYNFSLTDLKITGWFLSLVPPNFSTKKKTTKQPIAAFLSISIYWNSSCDRLLCVLVLKVAFQICQTFYV